jgi:uncharacterized membrane protein YecN with MAPEG domain
MLNWIAAASVSLIYPIAVELAGSPSLIFFIFGISVIVGYVLNKNWMVETKGKSEWRIRK